MKRKLSTSASATASDDGPQAKKPRVAKSKQKATQTASRNDADSAETKGARKGTNQGRSSRASNPVDDGESKAEIASAGEQTHVELLRSGFAAAGDAAKAAAMKKYMRGQFNFFGLQRPARNAVQKEMFASARRITTEAELIGQLKQLWALEQREFQLAALDLCQQHKKLWSAKLFPVLEEFVRQKSWWDTVDVLASNLIGKLVLDHPKLRTEVATQWIKSDNFWIQRVSLIHQLTYKDKTDEKALFAACLHVAGEQEFFLRKAIGWALRQYSKTNKKAVRAFIDTNKSKLSALSIKEGSKYC